MLFKRVVWIGTWAGPCLALTLMFAVLAQADQASDARSIMQGVRDRELGDKTRVRSEMTITDAAGRSRSRMMQSLGLKFGEGRKSLLFFEAPADVRNTGFLSIDYDDGERDDDQWLYLPGLHRTTRISSGGRSGAFMGSDLSYADMTRSDPDDYDFRLLQESVVVDGEACWLIEARPRTAKAKEETGYSKSEVWISKAKHMSVQSKSWIEQGRKLKYVKVSDVVKIDGIWTGRRIVARTVRDGELLSETIWKVTSAKYGDPSITDADFVERRLERGL